MLQDVKSGIAWCPFELMIMTCHCWLTGRPGAFKNKKAALRNIAIAIVAYCTCACKLSLRSMECAERTGACLQIWHTEFAGLVGSGEKRPMLKASAAGKEPNNHLHAQSAAFQLELPHRSTWRFHSHRPWPAKLLIPG